MTAPIFILAGEPSGDRLAASIMEAVNQEVGTQSWIGIGGPAMQSQGLQSNIGMDELTVFGFGAAIAAYPRLSRLADTLVDQIVAAKPSLIITVDVKGFSLRLAARLKVRMAAQGWSAPIIHTVAPTVWAWGAWRRHRVARVVDGLLCLFPFEPDYFLPLDIQATFIGHPEAFKPIYEVPKPRPGGHEQHVTLLPGSRRSEIKHLLVPMLEAFSLIRHHRPNAKATIPTLPHLRPLIVREMERRSELANHISIDTSEAGLFSALSRSQGVLAASGTVTLQTALYGVPGVACYIAPSLSAFIGRRIVNMDRVILPNALLGKQVYPFLFQEAATPHAMAETLLKILEDPNAQEDAASVAAELRAMLRGESDSFHDNVVTALQPWISGWRT